MAYGTTATFDDFIGDDLAGALSALDGATAADVITKARTGADAEVDAAMAQLYVVPFAAIVDVPATPAIITEISENLTAARLFRKRHPDDADDFQEEADRLLARLLDETYTVPGATRVDATDGKVGMAYRTTFEPKFAGRDSDGDDRMENF